MISGSNFYVLGRIGMDIYPEDRGKIADGGLMRPALGGSSGNIAAGLARLGASVEMISMVSDDPVGHFVRNQCVEYGIGTRYLWDAPIGTNTNLAMAENRLDDFSVVIYRNNAADLAIDGAHIDMIDFAPADALVVTGTALSAEPSRGASMLAMDCAKLSILDLDYRAAAWTNDDPAPVFTAACDVADVIVGNDEEFAILGGLSAARTLGQSKTVVYKMGAQGAITIDCGREFSTPIFPVDALKPVGAGDAFMAGMLMALAEGRAIDRAVVEGAAHAAMVVSRSACASAMATREELNSFLKQRGA